MDASIRGVTSRQQVAVRPWRDETLRSDPSTGRRHDEQVAPWRIAVLSGVSATQSADWTQRRFDDQILCNEALEDDGRPKGLSSEELPDEPDEVLFESIRRFKGLEREVIILVELPADGDRLDELLYVGMTRATTELVVIAPPGLAARLR